MNQEVALEPYARLLCRMKKLDFAQSLGIVANVGVIAGIVFLAVELRQNNELLVSQARMNSLLARASYQQYVATNEGGIADILLKVRDQELTGTEQFRLNVHWSLVLNNWASMFREVADGPLSESDMPIRVWAATMRNNPSLVEFWEQSKQDYSADFNEYLEGSVLTHFIE